MADPFRLSTNLRRIVRPVLQGRGFSLKGGTFRSARATIEQSIYFQRSQANILVGYGLMDKRYLYVNVHVTQKDPRRWTFERLPNPAVFRRASPVADWRSWWESLNKEEKLAIAKRAPDYEHWSYGTEPELQQQLAVVADELIARGLPYLDYVASIISDAEWHRLEWEAKKVLGIDWLVDYPEPPPILPPPKP